MPNIPAKGCTGCTACYSICPVDCISMEQDGEGFSYPAVNTDKCIGCGKCEQTCPLHVSPKLPETYEGAYVAQSTDDAVLDECTSGGFLDALSRYVTEKCGGYACGVCFDAQYMPVHRIFGTYGEAKAFRNSKYAQSMLGDTFREIKSLLDKEKAVLFIGTPCQVAGLVSYVGDGADKLITADLVCRSVPSRALWQKYLDYQREAHGSRIKSVVFRKKAYGYHSGALEIKFENAKTYTASNRTDYYMKAFHSDICSGPSCYECAFKTAHRCSDFTVFDSWEASAVTDDKVKDNDRGYSNVIAHTKKAARILGNLDGIELYPASAEKMFLYTGGMESRSIERKAARDTYYQDVEKYGYINATKKYVSVSTKDRMIEAAKPYRYKLKKLFGK